MMRQLAAGATALATWCAAAAILQPSFGHAAAFTAGNLVIYRVGVANDGTTPAGFADEVFIDEYTTSGTLVQSIPMPTATVGSQYQLVAHGNATVEGMLNRSPDGQWLTFGGYDAAVGVTDPRGTSAATINRVIARMDASGNLDTSTKLNNWAGGTDPRSVITLDGSTFFMTAGTGDVRTTTLGATTSTSYSTGVVTLRGLEVFNNEMYVATGWSQSTTSLAKIDSASPHAAQYLPGIPVSDNLDPPPPGGTPELDAYNFFMADLSSEVPGVDTVYVADNRGQNAVPQGGGLHKYSLVGGTWVDSGGVYGVQTPAASSLRGLTGVVNGTDVTLYATRFGSTLLKFFDNSGYNGTMTGTPVSLATAPTNTFFRGVEFAPVAPSEDDGDFDEDGDTDGNDFLLWQRGQSTNGLTLGDLNDWKANFGTATASTRAVPEPSTAILAIAALALLSARRRK